jgi:hypothetical protein
MVVQVLLIFHCVANIQCGDKGTKFIIALFNVFKQNARRSKFYFLISHLMT